YLALAGDAERLQETGDIRSSRERAEVALLLAQQIYDWAVRSDDARDKVDVRALTIQLADANLRADRYGEARELFGPLLATGDESIPSDSAGDVRVVLGYGESLFQLGEFALALSQFNRLAVGLPAADPIRWKSLLRDLQCRTALGHPPRDIIKVIRQQKHLYPGLGGPALASQFEKLLRQNERRPDFG
ncbi:unnamed protein product, partial [marine sediment metagenome]